MIAILTDPGKGGTFVNWSLHFLSGHDQYFYADKKQWTTLIHNPLSADENAHNFLPNQPTTVDSYTKIITALSETTNTFHSIYFHNFDYLQTSDIEMKTVVQDVCARADKTVLISNSNRNVLYDQKHKGRVLQSEFKNWDDQYQTHSNVFFQKSQEEWHALGLTNVWDKREFIALNARPYQSFTISKYIDPSMSYYFLDTEEVWTYFDECVHDLFSWLDIPLNSSRLQEWLPIYNQWKLFHHDRLKFCWYFDTIINNIINGVDMDLARFNLDIVRESVIQHVLIYDHGLNIKTWQLEKFINTRELHTLLETNTHPLTN